MPRKKARVAEGPRDFFGNLISTGDIIAVRQNVGQFVQMVRRRVTGIEPLLKKTARDPSHAVHHEHLDGGKEKRLLKTRACFIDMKEKYSRFVDQEGDTVVAA